jgi:hypothetical protein
MLFLSVNTRSPWRKILVLQFGTALAQRVEHSISKILDATPENSSGIRGMSPLLLISDHVSNFESQDEDFLSAERVFWSKVCAIANKIAMLVVTFRLNDADVTGKMPKEYSDLIGFTPFETFITKPKDFLSIEDAKEVLALHDSADVSSKKMSQESTRNPLDIRIKLARFLAIVETSAKVTKGVTASTISRLQGMKCNTTPKRRVMPLPRLTKPRLMKLTIKPPVCLFTNALIAVVGLRCWFLVHSWLT